MRVFPLVFLAAAMLISCENEQLVDMSKEEMHVIFFYEDSDEADLHKEAPYYNAIVELRNEFPEEFDRMILANPKDAKKFEKYIQVNDFPTILVVFQEKVLVQIDGHRTKEEIINPIKNVLINE